MSVGAWAQLGIATPNVNPNPFAYLDSETNKTSITAVNAASAWSRGWTGQGSTILLMDSGIDAKNPEFAGRIKYTIDFTNTGIQDKVGHGTHVAGIAAAANNNSLTQGIAFDANIAVAKITNTASVSMQSAQKALVWAGQYSDIVVANLSANLSYNSGYVSAMKQVAPGVFINTDKNYGGKNYYNLENPASWVIPKQIVLTVSAGNTKAGYVQSPAVFATATDDRGNLILGGQMLVVGNWNTSTNTVEGAQAGHICKNYTTTCLDKYKTSDFYILAPGSGIVSTGIGTGTKTMSGTSQAAPVVAGAVAIINQMWPYMTPANQVQLLLKTANKNLPNYNPNVMGQGLLDLDRATQPVGAVGLALTGRTGVVVPIAGNISIANTSSSTVAKLSSVAVVDEFQRDFRIDLTSTVSANTLMQNPVLLDADPGHNWSGRWTGLIAGQNLQTPITGMQTGSDSTLTMDSSIFNQPSKTRHQFTVTNSAYNPFVHFTGSYGQTRGATTVEYSALHHVGSQTHRHGLPQGLWAQAGVMMTSVHYNSGLVTNVTPIMSVHAMAGYQHNDWNFFAGIKPTVLSGEVHLTVPTSVDNEGVMQYNKVSNSLSGGAPIPYVGVKFQHTFQDGGQVKHTLGFRTALAQDKTSNIKAYYMAYF